MNSGICIRTFIGLLAGIALFASTRLMAQKVKILPAVRIGQAPLIDGYIDDLAWEGQAVADSFVQFYPFNGDAPLLQTQVKMVYDNTAIYVAAMLFDTPDSISTGLGQRDNLGAMADWFCVNIDPFGDGLKSYNFFVTAAGVQADRTQTPVSSDADWNAVWLSDVKFYENGWSVEMKIPYSALRFPKTGVQDWRVNFWRSLRRRGESSSWNFVDREVGNHLAQMGLFSGLTDLKPPLRLSLMPYASAYAERNASGGSSYSYKGGMDIKYGINQSFTLDMMLIPDFGQVQSDDVVLNLSPFEVKYDEKRAFFTEGSELFNRGNIFYSKRIGAKPRYASAASDSLRGNEVISQSPPTTQLINATKLSGKTNGGLSIGFLNAMTGTAKATLTDSLTGTSREVVTQPFTNYNLTVVEQSLRNNSYIALANSNYALQRYNANVTASELSLRDSKNRYTFFLRNSLSQKHLTGEKPEFGFAYALDAAKTAGTFQYGLEHRVYNDRYNINDLGFLSRNNRISNEVYFSYRSYKPWWGFIRNFLTIGVSNENLYMPRKFSELLLYFNVYGMLKNYYSFSLYTYYKPVAEYNYYEPRVGGRYYVEPVSQSAGLNFSTDNRKKYFISMRASFWQCPEYGSQSLGFGIGPDFTLSERWFLAIDVAGSNTQHTPGFVAKNESEDTIWFGDRNQKVITNTLYTSYTFNKKSSLSCRVRHYWSEVLYDSYFVLNHEGYPEPVEYHGEHDLNYNTFNIDMTYTWEFAPGSELSLVWKNAIQASDSGEFFPDYFDNLADVLHRPQTNNISLKLLYYIDYVNIKEKRLSPI